MSVLFAIVRCMETATALLAAFASLVILALLKVTVSETAGFLFGIVGMIAEGIVSALAWLVRRVFRLIWWLLIGWWWQRWVSPSNW